MTKILLWMCCVGLLYAQTMLFKEERYISAVDQTIVKRGSITFEKEFIKTTYDKSLETLVYSSDSLELNTENSTQRIDLNKNPYIQYFFEILRAIYFDNIQSLEEYFTVQQSDTETLLLPNASLRSYIQKVVYQKQSHLNYLVITLTNDDRIRIEQRDP